jgi:hypothetical protein
MITLPTSKLSPTPANGIAKAERQSGRLTPKRCQRSTKTDRKQTEDCDETVPTEQRSDHQADTGYRGDHKAHDPFMAERRYRQSHHRQNPDGQSEPGIDIEDQRNDYDGPWELVCAWIVQSASYVHAVMRSPDARRPADKPQ